MLNYEWQLRSSGDAPDWQKGSVVVGTILLLYLIARQASYKEISWKEFYSDYLGRGNVCIYILLSYLIFYSILQNIKLTYKVQRLEVVDKKWVRVVTSIPSTVSLKFSAQKQRFLSQYTYFFNIGSVESFERSLAAAQRFLGIEAEKQVPVLYKSEFDVYVNLFFFSNQYFCIFRQQLPAILNLVIPIALGYFIFRGMFGAGMGYFNSIYI